VDTINHETCYMRRWDNGGEAARRGSMLESCALGHLGCVDNLCGFVPNTYAHLTTGKRMGEDSNGDLPRRQRGRCHRRPDLFPCSIKRVTERGRYGRRFRPVRVHQIPALDDGDFRVDGEEWGMGRSNAETCDAARCYAATVPQHVRRNDSEHCVGRDGERTQSGTVRGVVAPEPGSVSRAG